MSNAAKFCEEERDQPSDCAGNTRDQVDDDDDDDDDDDVKRGSRGVSVVVRMSEVACIDQTSASAWVL